MTDFLGGYYVALIVGLLPYAAIKGSLRLAAAERAGDPLGGPKPQPVGRALQVRALALQLVMLALALFVAHAHGYLGLLFPPPAFAAPELALGAAFLTVGIGTMRWRFATLPERRRRRLAMLMPQSAAEWRVYAPVALAAGIGEEIVYRGVLVNELQWMLDSWWLAAAISLVAFTVAHCSQGPRAMLIIVVFTALFHAIVRMTGSLYVVIALHAIYDLAAGAIFGPLTRGLRPVPADELRRRSAGTSAAP